MSYHKRHIFHRLIYITVQLYFHRLYNVEVISLNLVLDIHIIDNLLNSQLKHKRIFPSRLCLSPYLPFRLISAYTPATESEHWAQWDLTLSHGNQSPPTNRPSTLPRLNRIIVDRPFLVSSPSKHSFIILITMSSAGFRKTLSRLPELCTSSVWHSKIDPLCGAFDAYYGFMTAKITMASYGCRREAHNGELEYRLKLQGRRTAPVIETEETLRLGSCFVFTAQSVNIP